MVRRFVYPTIHKYSKRKCLQIQRECEDGQLWFGIEDAIKNYIEEYGLKIEDIEWFVDPNPDNIHSEYSIIIAKDLNEWIRKFEQLDIKWRED